MIIVDSREKEKIRKYLVLKGLKFKVEALPVGDYICSDDKNPEDRIVIERKNIGDLISSVGDGRLEKQMRNMSSEKFPVLLVTGSVKDVKGLPFKVDPKLVEQVISKAVVNYGFRSVVWIVSGFKDTKLEGLKFVVDAMNLVSKGGLDKMEDRKWVKKYDERIDAVRVLLGVPVNVAVNLLNKFGNVMSVISATDRQLLSVEGMGVTRLKYMKFVMKEKMKSGKMKNDKSNDNKSNKHNDKKMKRKVKVGDKIVWI